MIPCISFFMIIRNRTTNPLNTTQRRRVRRDVFCQLIVLRTQRRAITARDRRDLQIPMRERKWTVREKTLRPRAVTARLCGRRHRVEKNTSAHSASLRGIVSGMIADNHFFFLYHELHEYHEPESLCGCPEFMSSTMNGGNHQRWMLRIYTSTADNKAVRLHHSWLPSSLRRP